jgi:hypothetical protein
MPLVSVRGYRRLRKKASVRAEAAAPQALELLS